MLVSICIPTYNSGDKLVRLLDSIKIQTYRDFEIIISDDSNNSEVKECINAKYSDLNIKYYHNQKALGTPSNWNNAVNLTNGEWIKIMHHDDWFYNEHSLQEFVNYSKINQSAKLIFSAFNNVYLDLGNERISRCSKFEILILKWNYLNLFKTFLGNPTCTFIHKSCKPYKYDTNFKWLIDFDFFTAFFKKYPEVHYIDKPLVSLGMHKGQVTETVFQNASVEIPESLSLLDNHGVKILKNFYVFDFYWRLYRNINIRSLAQFNSFVKKPCNYKLIIDIIKIQSKINPTILKNGICSKFLIITFYIRNLILR